MAFNVSMAETTGFLDNGVFWGLIMDDRESNPNDHNPGEPQDRNDAWLWWEKWWAPVTQNPDGTVNQIGNSAWMNDNRRDMKARRTIRALDQTLFFALESTGSLITASEWSFSILLRLP